MDSFLLNPHTGLYIRPIRAGDEEQHFVTVDEHREVLGTNLPWVDSTDSRRVSARYVARAVEQNADGVAARYGIFMPDPAFDNLIGIFNLVKPNDDPGGSHAVFGLWLTPGTNEIYAVMAGQTALDQVAKQLGVTTVSYNFMEGDEFALTLAERLGFEFSRQTEKTRHRGKQRQYLRYVKILKVSG